MDKHEKDIELTEEELTMSKKLDQLAKSQDTTEANNRFITKAILEQLVDAARRMKFLVNADAKIINQRVPSLIAFYKYNESMPYKIQIMNLAAVNSMTPPDAEAKILFDGAEVMSFFAQNNGVKYRTSLALHDYCKNVYPELLANKQLNYISPWALGDSLSEKILSMNITVDKPQNVKRNLEEALGEDLEPSDLDGILYMNYFDSSPGHYRGVDKEMDFYLGITENTINKKLLCPDVIIVCTPSNDEDVIVTSFNTKTGYDAKKKVWKDDRMALTRKFREQMKKYNMTDSKMQDSNRIKNSRLNKARAASTLKY